MPAIWHIFHSVLASTRQLRDQIAFVLWPRHASQQHKHTTYAQDDRETCRVHVNRVLGEVQRKNEKQSDRKPATAMAAPID